MTRFVLPSLVALGLAVSVTAQPAKDGPFRALGYTAADLAETAPTSANPFTALLRPGVEPDVGYWTAKTQIDSRERGLRRALRGLRALPTARVRERERGRFNPNDDPATAQPLAGLRAVDEPLVEITGRLEAVAPIVAADVVTNRDEGETAGGEIAPWWLAFGEADGGFAVARIGAVIGDGTFGSTSGDVDAFEFEVEQPNTYFRLAVDTPESDLDPVMALYGPEGYPILVNDDAYPGTDSQGGIFLARPGTYRLYVWGFTPGDPPVPALRNRFDPSSGYGVGSTGAYVLRVEAIRPDEDHYAVHLRAGDVVAAATASGTVSDLAIYDPDGELRMLSRIDYSSYYGEDGPLVSPSELPGGGTGVTAALVAPVSGVYSVAARGEGDYSLTIQVLPAGPQRSPRGGPEQIFVDFDGGRYTPLADVGEGYEEATLSPLSSFLPRWGLTAADEDVVIDAVLARIRRHLRDGLRQDVPGMGGFEVEILNSRDHADPGRRSGVSRIVVGGTEEEVGIPGIYGQASSIDIGNYSRNDVAYVLLDSYSDPASSPSSLNQFEVGPTRTKAGLVAVGVGFTAAHEAGHFFGLHHTHSHNGVLNIMDEGGGFIGVGLDIGLDGVFGPGDGEGVRFREDEFQVYYPFAGVQRTPDALALSLGGPPSDDRVTDPVAMASATAAFSPLVREVALASGSVRPLYSTSRGLTAGASAWDLTTDRGGTISTSDGRTITVVSTTSERVRAWPRGMMNSSGGVLARATVRRLPGSSACASAGFFTGLVGTQDAAHILADSGSGSESTQRWTFLAGRGWVHQTMAIPASGTFTMEVVVLGRHGRLLINGAPVLTPDGIPDFALDGRAGIAGLTVNSCGDSAGRFSFSDVEVFAIGERAPAVTQVAGAPGGMRGLAGRTEGGAATVRSSSPPQRVPSGEVGTGGLRGRGGAVGVAPASVGPAGYVYTFRQGASLWRVRLAEGGDVWVQPPGSETWREAQPGEVASLLGTAEAEAVVTETALSDEEAEVAIEALYRIIGSN